MYRIVALLGCLALPVGAQTLSPEEILAQVEEKVAAKNPYQALLNDPDPARSMAAMQIMMSSGDAMLVSLATEFGLLSPNSQVQRAALEGYLGTGPVLTMRMDGAGVGENNIWFANHLNTLGGTVTSDKIGFFQISLGKFDPETQCFTWSSRDGCAVQVNVTGMLVTTGGRPDLRAKLDLTTEGALQGTATMDKVGPVPVTIQLID